MQPHTASVCPQCSYDANSETATHCEICGSSLQPSSDHNPNLRFQPPRQLLKLTIVPVFLLVFAITIGYLLRRSPNSNLASPALQDSSSNSDRTSLTLLGDTFSGYSTFRSQAFQAALQEVGINLRYIDEFDQTKRAERLNQGTADLLVTTLDQFLKQQPQGKIVGLIDITVGADAVVLNTKKYPQLKSLLELNKLVQQTNSQKQQLSITFAGDTPSEYLALVLSTKFDQFALSDFQLNRVADASHAWQLLQDPKQNVAVGVLWEPYVTQARQQGYTVVISSQDVPGTIVDVIVASDRILQSQPEKVAEFLATYYRRIDANTSDASQLKDQIAADGELSPSEANTVMRGIKFFTAVEAKNWLTDATLEKRIGSTAAVLALAGKTPQVPQTPQNLFTPQFITKAANNTQSLISLVGADHPELAARLAGKNAITPTDTTTANQGKTTDIGDLQVRGDVSFNFSSAELTPQGKQTLNQLATEISEFNPQTVAVRVIGHTSRAGLPELNQKLSLQRAQVVAAYLRSRAVEHKIAAEGKGFSQPLPGVSAADLRNQRTEIRLVRLNK